MHRAHSGSLSDDDEKNHITQPRSSSKGSDTAPTDSSIIFRVTFRGATILVGRPASEFTCTRDKNRHSSIPIDYVIQLLTNASIMAQSIENADASGSKTAHISLEDFSASINTDFQHVDLAEAPPMLSPIAADFRLV